MVFLGFGVDSLASMVGSGTAEPICEGPDPVNCDLGLFRGVFNAVYLLVGVPLFSYTLGQVG